MRFVVVLMAALAFLIALPALALLGPGSDMFAASAQPKPDEGATGPGEPPPKPDPK